MTASGRGRTLILAHRATMGHAPENSLAGLRAGLALGVDGFEVDVRITADGVPVLLHDEDLSRTTSGSGPLSSHSFASIRSLKGDGGEPIPTLAEALAVVGGRAALMIELKAGAEQDPAALVDAVMEEVGDHDAATRVWLWSFDPGLLTVAAQRSLAVPVAHLCREPDTDVLTRVNALGLAGVALHGSAAREDLVARLRSEGLATFVWTVNEPAHLSRMARLDLSGIVTDYPERARTALQAVAQS